jgi:SDR family mycofactocin-dependent oxidoreductase
MISEIVKEDTVTEPLAGKVAFITGLARGQGRAHALRLAGAGADIIGVDVCATLDGVEYPMSQTDDLQETVKLVEGLDRRIVAEIADVRDREGLAAAYERGLGEFGRLDFIVANAGVMPVFGARSNEMNAWQLCLDVLLTGVLNTVELGYKHIVSHGEGGSIVITSSAAGLQPMMRTEGSHTLGLLGYSAAKAAVVNLARNYASILAAHRIRVNTIHPSAVNTPMINNEMLARYWETADPEDLKALVNAIPVDAVEPEDIANAVFWLCSDNSKYVTGQQVRVDAGANLR